MYKTITLHLLEQHPPVTIQRLDHFSADLRDRHLTWMSLLSQQRPNSDPSEIASEAMELALKELEERLESEFPTEESETPA